MSKVFKKQFIYYPVNYSSFQRSEIYSFALRMHDGRWIVLWWLCDIFQRIAKEPFVSRLPLMTYVRHLEPGSTLFSGKICMRSHCNGIGLCYCSSVHLVLRFGSWMILVSCLALTAFLLYMFVICVSLISLVHPRVAQLIIDARVAAGFRKHLTIPLNNGSQSTGWQLIDIM